MDDKAVGRLIMLRARMREQVAIAEDRQRKLSAGLQRALESDPGIRGETPWETEYKWNTSVQAKSWLADQVWAWRRANGYAAVIAAEIAVEQTLDAEANHPLCSPLDTR